MGIECGTGERTGRVNKNRRTQPRYAGRGLAVLAILAAGCSSGGSGEADADIEDRRPPTATIPVESPENIYPCREDVNSTTYRNTFPIEPDQSERLLGNEGDDEQQDAWKDQRSVIKKQIDKDPLPDAKFIVQVDVSYPNPAGEHAAIVQAQALAKSFTTQAFPMPVETLLPSASPADKPGTRLYVYAIVGGDISDAVGCPVPPPLPTTPALP